MEEHTARRGFEEVEWIKALIHNCDYIAEGGCGPGGTPLPAAQGNRH